MKKIIPIDGVNYTDQTDVIKLMLLNGKPIWNCKNRIRKVMIPKNIVWKYYLFVKIYIRILILRIQSSVAVTYKLGSKSYHDILESI